MIPKTLRTSAVINLPAISQPSFDPAVLPDSPVGAGVVIGRKAYHTVNPNLRSFSPARSGSVSFWKASSCVPETKDLNRLLLLIDPVDNSVGPHNDLAYRVIASSGTTRPR